MLSVSGVSKPEFHLWHGANPTLFSDQYNQAYCLWESVWRETFKQLEGTEKIYSDDFTRQDRIIAIFQDNQCVAVAGHKDFDLTQPTAIQDSYFKPWSKEALNRLTQNGPLVFGLNYLAVHPQFRGPTEGGLSFKDLLISLSVLFLLESKYDAMSGITRNNKGVNRSAYDSSATSIQTNLNYHNVAIDLVAFFRTEIDRSRPSLSHVQTYRLWKERTEHRTQILDSYQKFSQQKEVV